jgi:hypothetical protein
MWKRAVRSGTTGCKKAANSMQSASFHRRADPGDTEAIVGLRYCHLRTKTGAERLKEVACSSQEEWCRSGDPKWRAVYFAFLTGVYSALGIMCNPPHETLVTPVKAAWVNLLTTFCDCLAFVSRSRVDYSTRIAYTEFILNVRAGNCRGLTRSSGAMTQAGGSAACFA